jgi:hypothetical protein
MKTYLLFPAVLLVAIAFIFMVRPKQKGNQIVIPVVVGENIKENVYLGFLDEIVDPSKKNEKYLVAVLDDLCSSCMSGQILFKLDSLQRQRKNIQTYILLPSKYSANDLSNMKSNYDLKLNFKTISAKLEAFIQSNQKAFSRKGIIGAICLIDSNGEVKLIQPVKLSVPFREIITLITKELT